MEHRFTKKISVQFSLKGAPDSVKHSDEPETYPKRFPSKPGSEGDKIAHAVMERIKLAFKP